MQMFNLMNLFYDNVEYDTFLNDLKSKNTCIMLFDGDGRIQGFSTQKLLSLPVDDKDIVGLFSGDTIIHRDYWGNWALFQLLMRYGVELGKQYENFYWFLISKGYKTYKTLPLFFKDFYPNRNVKTPERMQRLIDSYGHVIYPDDFNRVTGVIEYRLTKDRLRKGIADVTPRHLSDPDIAFFCKKNPGYIVGNDLVCITSFSENNLTARGKQLLL